MARAELVLKSGTKVNIEGTHEEVGAIVKALSGKPESINSAPDFSLKAQKKESVRHGPIPRIRILISENYYEQKRTIGETKDRLAEQGYIYASPSLSPALFRLVKAGALRRVKEAGAWKYVNP